MKRLVLSIFLLFWIDGLVMAQLKPIPDLRLGKVQEDRTETDCEGNQQSIYGQLASGKPLMIIYDGHNCINCKNLAPAVGEYIQKNHNRINFWSPLLKMVVPVNCAEVHQWDRWFPGFEHSFSFPVDHTYYHDYYGTSFNLPFFIVIDPKTKQVVFSAGNDNYRGGAREAFEHATQIAESLIPPALNKNSISFKQTYKILNKKILHADSMVEANIDFQNFSDTLSRFVWEYDKMNMPVSWFAVLCDPIGCRDPKLTESIFTTSPGSKGHFGITVFPYGNSGIGSATVQVYPPGSKSEHVSTTCAFINYIPQNSLGDEKTKSRLYADTKITITLTDQEEQVLYTLADDKLENLAEDLVVVENGKIKVNGKPVELKTETIQKVYLNYFMEGFLVKQDEITGALK